MIDKILQQLKELHTQLEHTPHGAKVWNIYEQLLRVECELGSDDYMGTTLYTGGSND